MLFTQGTTIHPVEGTAFTGILATFSTANPYALATDFTITPGAVTVDWGDGTIESTDTPGSTIVVTKVGFTPNGIAFTVSGTHIYPEEGAHQIVVTIHSAFGSEAVALTDAQIADAPLQPSSTQPQILAQKAHRFSHPVAAFTDANPGASIRDFKAIIYWGDGSPATAGTLTESTGGQFIVSGTHAYNHPIKKGSFGRFPVTVYVADIGGAAVNLSNTALIFNGAKPGFRTTTDKVSRPKPAVATKPKVPVAAAQPARPAWPVHPHDLALAQVRVKKAW